MMKSVNVKTSPLQALSRLLTIVFAATAVFLGGCAVARDQSTVGEYVDDSVISTQVKTKFIESKQVDASSIEVESLKGTVQLSGFAKNATEKSTAERLAQSVKGVKSVKNDIVVRP